MGKICLYGEGVLREKAKEVSEIDAGTAGLIKRMRSIMDDCRGVGLAATQVGVLKRIFIASPPGEEGHIVAINPRIILPEDDSEIDLEGCLSFPEIYFSIQRAKTAVLRAMDINGKEFAIEVDGLLARCFQHELDHLNGKLIIDYASEAEKEKAREIIDKIRS